MKRLVLKKGFSLNRTPEGATHLVDGRTGDALLLAPADFDALSQAMRSGGLDADASGPATLAYRFGPFLSLTTELETRSFYELDLGDAPQEPEVPTIPAVAPVAPARTTTGSIPSFQELSSRPFSTPAPRTQTSTVPAIPAVAPVAPRPSPVPPIPPVRSGSSGFREASPSLAGDWPETWNLLPVTTPVPATAPAAPPAPSTPSSGGDEWAVTAAMPEAEAESPLTGPRLAEAVSPLLPSIDDLIGQALPGVAADTSSGSLPGTRVPSPVPASTARTEVVPVLSSTSSDRTEVVAALPERGAETPTPQKTSLAPTASELELRDALAAAAQQPAPATMPDDEPLPTAELLPMDDTLEEVPDGVLEALPEPAPAPDRSQEDNLRAALEQSAPAPTTSAEVQAFLSDTAKTLSPPASAPVPAPAPAPAPVEPGPTLDALPSSRKPMVLTFVGVTLLVLGVSASMMLKPGGGDTKPTEPTPAAVVDAGATTTSPTAPTPTPPVKVDAGAAPGAAPVVDAGAPTPVPVVDAGKPQPPPVVDAGVAAPPPAEGPFFTAEVIARGRVKMGEVAAPGEGAVSWAVDDAQRVKSKQVLGTVTVDGAPKNLLAPSVGLAMLKEASGATVKKGVVLAEIIYFEAWAKALVKGAVPTPSWRCEVLSESSGQRAPCKISVVTPKGGNAQVTVAIEPRWFDGAADAVLHVQPE